MIVDFHAFTDIEANKLKYAVIVARHNDKWVYVRHRDRATWEIPGGHREPNEDVFNAAKRELFEETGAIAFRLFPVCVYSVTNTRTKNYGGLFFADISSFANLPSFEIRELHFSSSLPVELTYPKIQPFLQKKVEEHLAKTSGVTVTP